MRGSTRCHSYTESSSNTNRSTNSLLYSYGNISRDHLKVTRCDEWPAAPRSSRLLTGDFRGSAFQSNVPYFFFFNLGNVGFGSQPKEVKETYPPFVYMFLLCMLRFQILDPNVSVF